jgi:hypothetical protein
MKLPRFHLVLSLLVFLSPCLRVLHAADPKDEPITPKEAIKLFNDKDLTGFHSWVKGTGREDPKKVFTADHGMIHVSGEVNGYLATDKEYRDYHLTAEFKWGEKTYGAKFVRNSGILLHAIGPDGGANGVWMSSVECQLAQGCVGDLIVIRGKDADDKEIPVSFKSETVLGPDKHPRWKKGGEVREFTKGQLWWNKHDPDFKELIDTRGKDDVESPLGEWTKVEIICDGSKMTVVVNDQTINECFDVKPAAGGILLQSEGFEVYFRKVELKPLKK